MSSAASEVLWIGRADPGDGARTIRVRTRGPAPGPEDIAEEIDDPFADEDGDPWTLAAAPARGGGLRAPLGGLRLRPPVRPSKIVCVGRNYRAHAAELGNEVPSEPLLFFKPPSCLVVSGEAVALPRGYARIDMESELVVVVGRRARDVSAAQAWGHVAGYALGNDVSNRDLQKQDKQWTRAKGFDGFGPVSAFVRLTPPGQPLPEAAIVGWLNGQVKQRAALADVVFDVPTLIAYISACMTLLPGDLIFTGTPEGVSALAPGDVVRVALEGFELGALETTFA